MKKRRLYVTPQLECMDCQCSTLIMTSAIYFADQPNGAEPYNPESDKGDNIGDWEPGEGLEFDFEE